MKLTAAVRKRRTVLIVAMLRLKDEAGKLELWKTMHALDNATTTVGWEIDEQERAQ